MSSKRGSRSGRAAAWRGALLLAGLLAPAGSAAAQAQSSGPTVEQVQRAVDDYFADDARALEARAQLREWGDAAIPHLRTIAGEPSALPDVMAVRAFSLIEDHSTACAIDEIGTDAAIDLLMDIADGKTGVHPDNGLEQLQMGARYKWKDKLSSDPHFKALVLRSTLAKGEFDSLKRRQAAETIADLGWTDATEVVEAMLNDPDLDVADSAAAAIYKLTGREVEVRRPPSHFPGQLEGQPPLSAPMDVPRAQRMRAAFGYWIDGRAGLLTSRVGVLALYGPGGEMLEHWDVAGAIAAFCSFERPDGQGRWVVGLTTEEFGGDVSVVESRDFEGAVRWRFEPKQASDAVIVPLYDSDGACGVAVGLGGHDGIVRFDDDGQQLWSLWSPVLYELRTHRALPGRLLVCSGDLRLVDSAGKATTPNKHGGSGTPRGQWIYATHALLFPDRDGHPAIIASGEGAKSGPAIVRLDENLAEVWRAAVPGDIEGLALIEPEDGPLLFAAACKTGELYVFDANGSVFEPIRLVDSLKPGGRMPVYAMDAGPFEDGSWGLAIALLEKTVLFRVE